MPPKKKTAFVDPLSEVPDRPIAFQRAFKRITGSTVASLFLSQAWYWSIRTKDPNGWFYKTQKEWEEETGLTRCEQETARKHLRDLNILSEKLRTIPARLYYQVNKDTVMHLLGLQFAGFQHTSAPETSVQASGILSSINKYSETTTEITTHLAKSTPKTSRRKKQEEEDIIKIQNIPDGLIQELTDAGVYRQLWEEVASALSVGRSTADMLALLAWTKDPRKFISRLRDNSKAPSRYYDFSERRMAGKWTPEGA